MTLVTWALLALFVPLGVAAFIGLIVPLRRTGRPAALISVAGALVSLASAGMVLAGGSAALKPGVHATVGWLTAGTATAVGVHLDGTSAWMLLVVTLVATCVQIYSLGYLHDEPPPALGRYFTYQSLFLFAMNTLVLAPNLLQAFLGWELVGLVSYLLIGFYFRKPSAAKAAVKAFWVTKFADLGFLIGLVTLYAQTGGFEWTAVTPAATFVTLMLFFAVMGKSAQFPLHIWLPDAMEGPTPVSALLHAATMVAAGVFLIVRAEPLFEQAALTRDVMAYVGAFTALFAACVAVVQSDIKKVLAYSTCSQLGYMVAALGAGDTFAGYFHLSTHAFFKALLFLGAGSLIHAVHSNELKDMGGLFKKMPFSGTVFVVGALALAGVPPLAGFFSKDLILEAMHHHGLHVPLAALAIAAFLTAFYMTRTVMLALFGTPSHAAEHAHEPGIDMKLPLAVLALLAVGAGFLGGPLAGLTGHDYAFHFTPVGGAGTAIGLVGIGTGYFMFGPAQGGAAIKRGFTPVGAFIRYGLMDRLATVAYGIMLAVGAIIAWIDRYVIDGLMNWSGWILLVLGRRLRALQTGNVQDYVYAVALAVVVFGAWGILR
jgi:NADH-quinone oxidoreductase subunit L